MSSDENGLLSVHLLRHGIGNVMEPSMVNSAVSVQLAAKVLVFSANNRVTDGNKTFQTMNSFNTGKRYKMNPISSSLKAL